MSNDTNKPNSGTDQRKAPDTNSPSPSMPKQPTAGDGRTGEGDEQGSERKAPGTHMPQSSNPGSTGSGNAPKLPGQDSNAPGSNTTRSQDGRTPDANKNEQKPDARTDQDRKSPAL